MQHVAHASVLAGLLAATSAAQCELTQLYDCDAPAFLGAGDPEDFGAALAVDGATWVVGNPGANAVVAHDGTVHVYELVGLHPYLRAVLDSPGYHPDFGRHVDLDEDQLVASDGSRRFDVFERTGGPSGPWCHAGRFDAPNNFEQLGNDVAIDGDRILVGAKVNPDGLVRVYERTAFGWAETAQLTIPPNLFNRFGEALALQGDTAVVGAFGESGPAGERGAVYVYDHDGAAWNLTQKLLPSTTAVGAFGRDVAISGDRIAVGAPTSALPQSDAGAVTTFRLVAGVWTEEHTLVPATPDTGAGFGTSLDLVGGRLVVGAPGDDVQHGATYAFDVDAGGWSQVAKLAAANRRQGDAGGTDVATDGDLVLVGIPGDDDQGPEYGSVSVFSAAGTTCASLERFPLRVSLSTGGTHSLQLRAGPAHAGRTYWVAGSLAGTDPGVLLRGLPVPLVVDDYFRFSVQQANTPSFVNTLGTLDGAGRNNAQIVVPPSSPASLAGRKLFHAYVVFEGGLSGPLRHVSNAVSLRLDP